MENPSALVVPSGITRINPFPSAITLLPSQLGAAAPAIKSYNFDGTSHLSSTYDPSTIGTGDISVSMWVKVPYLPGTTEYIWCLGNDDLSDTLALRIISDKIQLFGQVGATGGVSLTAANILLNDFWQHVVITRTGTTVELFVNGTSQGSSINAEWAADLSGGETWFAYQGGAASFTGDIANIEIRSEVLTDSEIYNKFRSYTDYTTGTAQDVPITNNGATASNSVIPLAWSNNHGFYFDGVNDQISLGSLSSLNSISQFSISFWFKASPDNSSGQIFGAWGAVANNNIGVSPNYDLDIFYFIVRNGSGTASLQVSSMSTYAPANTWNHVVVTFDGGDREIYINGVSRASDTGVAPSTTSATCGDTVAWGNREGNFLEGFIDEGYIFDKVLSASEIADLYNADTPQDISISNQLSYLHEGTGADWSGNNNLATLQSGATASSDVPVLTIPDWVLEHSLDFSGTSQYGVIKDADALSFGNGSTDSAFSIAAWIKMDDATKFRIVAKQQSASVIEYIFGVDGLDKLGVNLYDGTDSNRRGIQSSITLTSYEGQWVHVAVTYDGRGGINAQDGMTLYLNGSVLSTTDNTGGSYTAMHNTTGNLWIGASEYTPDYANGKIASAGIWSAELDADAMLFLAQNPAHDLNVDSSNYDYSANIVAAYAIETGFGPFVIDYSGNGYHATAPSGAAPTWTTDVPS